MNNVILAGRLVANPELKTTQSGVEVTSFRIAVNQNYVKQGEERKADFFNIVAWRQTAAFICRYFHKGDGINIVGKLQSRSYVADDGSNRYVVEVVADSVEFPLANSNKEGQEYNQVTDVTSTSHQLVGVIQLPVDEDLPF